MTWLKFDRIIIISLDKTLQLNMFAKIAVLTALATATQALSLTTETEWAGCVPSQANYEKRYHPNQVDLWHWMQFCPYLTQDKCTNAAKYPNGSDGNCQNGVPNLNGRECIPNKAHQSYNGTVRDDDYRLWVNRCETLAGPNCASTVEWPAGGGNRCFKPNKHLITHCNLTKRIDDMKDTDRHADYLEWK
jgi:hypothetical protein